MKKTSEKIDYSRSKTAILASYIARHKKLFIIDMLLSVIVAATDLIFPYISRWTMYELLPNNAFKTFFIVMAIILASFILKAIFSVLVTTIGHQMGIRVEADMRADIFGHMEKLSYDYYDKNRTGVLLGRVTNDLFEITELAHHGPENLLTCGLTIVGALIFMLTINWKLGLVLCVITPLLLWFCLWTRKKMQDANKDVKKVTGEINAAIESSISGIRTAKAFANEEIENDKFSESNEAYKKSKTRYYQWMGICFGGMEGFVGIMQVIVIALGGFMIMKGELNYIDLITFTLFVSTFAVPVRKLGLSLEIFAQGLAGLERFTEVMRTEPSVKDAENAADIGEVKGYIEYRDVSFSYGDGTEVLKDINVTIEPGKTLALVGSSGGGKTTMSHLLPRFYDVTKGAVLVDGKDVRDVTQQSLRRNIGIIQQDVFLFAGSIMDNIRYGRPDASDEEVKRAAALARIHDDIIKMPEGYDTFVGERGIILSGGQKQRISIARVFLKDPPVLILDEATSALDSVTEKQIQDALARLSKGKTTIVIAHRLSTIKDADCIALIDDKRIAEMGTREELLKLDGAYAALEKAQELK